jgi:hypothetical protein
MFVAHSQWNFSRWENLRIAYTASEYATWNCEVHQQYSCIAQERWS